jgi:hypothetical protein
MIITTSVPVIRSYLMELIVKFVITQRIQHYLNMFYNYIFYFLKLNSCWALPCQYGSSCMSKGSNYTFTCISSFYGPSCENFLILSVTEMQQLKTLLNIPQN